MEGNEGIEVVMESRKKMKVTQQNWREYKYVVEFNKRWLEKLEINWKA